MSKKKKAGVISGVVAGVGVTAGAVAGYLHRDKLKEKFTGLKDKVSKRKEDFGKTGVDESFDDKEEE